jgi:hypothetical protein
VDEHHDDLTVFEWRRGRAFGYQPSTGFVACGNRVEMVLLQKPGVLFELLSPKVKTTVNHRF